MLIVTVLVKSAEKLLHFSTIAWLLLLSSQTLRLAGIIGGIIGVEEEISSPPHLFTIYYGKLGLCAVYNMYLGTLLLTLQND